MTVIWNAAKGFWRAMTGIAPGAVLFAILSSAAAAAEMRGCPDYITSCLCPAGCYQQYCEKACSTRFATAEYCAYTCGSCECQAYACLPTSRLFGMLRLLAAPAHSEEPALRAPKGRKEVTNPDGDFVMIPRAEAEKLGAENGGIGIALQQSTGDFVIAGVENEGPAAKAGLKKGDAVVQVDGKRTKGTPLQSVAEWIRGRPGTMVSLLIQGKDGKKRKIALIRASREAIRRPEEATIVGKTVPLSTFEGGTCPQELDGCHFLMLESDGCVFTCKREK